VQRKRFGRLDSVSLGGIAVFGALSVLLTILSQALGLNFPLIPYLQFDFGEVAILLSFFIFGPFPSLVSAFIEFLTLMAIGQNAPIGPVLKLLSILTSIVGFWAGTAIISHLKTPGLGKAAGLGAFLGIVSRVIFLTAANYYLIVFFGGQYALSGLVPYLAGFFKPIGINLNAANGLDVILLFTGAFNALQLLFVTAISVFILRLPQVRSTRAAGRRFWITMYLERRSTPTSVQQASHEEARQGV
jgi:riboflavin transporter FmnP